MLSPPMPMSSSSTGTKPSGASNPGVATGTKAVASGATPESISARRRLAWALFGSSSRARSTAVRASSPRISWRRRWALAMCCSTRKTRFCSASDMSSQSSGDRSSVSKVGSVSRFVREAQDVAKKTARKSAVAAFLIECSLAIGRSPREGGGDCNTEVERVGYRLVSKALSNASLVPNSAAAGMPRKDRRAALSERGHDSSYGASWQTALAKNNPLPGKDLAPPTGFESRPPA